MSPNLVPITLKINGGSREVSVFPAETLSHTLRERLGLTGTKLMCNNGACGSCTVLIDNVPVLSCLTLSIECEGRNITTIEGLADPQSGKLHPVQQAFIEHSGMQCGVCTPGTILTAKALLDANPCPTQDQVREALAGNLCRCGNYNRITESVIAAANIAKKEEK